MAEARVDVWLDGMPRIDIDPRGERISITEHGSPNYNHHITIFLSRIDRAVVMRAAEAFNAVVDHARAETDRPAQAAE